MASWKNESMKKTHVAEDASSTQYMALMYGSNSSNAMCAYVVAIANQQHDSTSK
jgi:hypothetical protein